MVGIIMGDTIQIKSKDGFDEWTLDNGHGNLSVPM